MHIDEPTLTVVLGCASWIAAGMFFTLKIFAQRIPGLHYWSLGCFSVGTALILDGPRIVEDWQLASMLFNILFTSGQALFLAGIMQFCGVKHSVRILAALLLVGVVLTIWFTYVIPDSTLRILLLSAYQMCINLWSAVILWRFPDRLSRTVFRFAGAIWLLQATAALAQGLIVASSGLEITYAAPQLPIANIISWAGTMINILVGSWTLFLLVMLRLVAELEFAADIDLLTGLANRRGLRRYIDSVLTRLRDGDGVVGVLLLDIDHFKAVNDMFGHHGGDKVLVTMGEVLSELTTASISPSRWGGEEFCVVVENATGASLVALAEEIRARFLLRSATVTGDGKGRTVSVGIAHNKSGSKLEIAKLMSAADAQLYLAKASGRNCAFLVEV